jgi:RNA polymerase sigma factor (sigma-70 family)
MLLRKPGSGFFAYVELDSVAAALTPRLIAYALGRTGCRDAAEDVAQDALTALVRRWRQSGPPSSVEAFTFAIAKRRANRFIARRAFAAPIDAIRHIARDEPGPEQSFDDRRELSVVLAALHTLSRVDREALLMRAVGGLSFEDIATVFHTSVAAVKMRVSRARRRLVTMLPEQSNGRRT